MSHKWGKVEFDDLVKGDVFRVNGYQPREYIMVSRDLNDNVIKAIDPEPETSLIFFTDGNVFTRKTEIPSESNDRKDETIFELTDLLYAEREQHKQTRARLTELQEKWEAKRESEWAALELRGETWEKVEFQDIRVGDTVRVFGYLDDSDGKPLKVRETWEDFLKFEGHHGISDWKDPNMHWERLFRPIKNHGCCGSCHGAYDASEG
jgi:hypothetical protein